MSDFRYDAVVAETWGDLTGEDIPERARETIARLGGDTDVSAPFAAIHVPEWLLKEKSVDTVEGSDTVVYTQILQASEKAIEVKYAGEHEWLPLSQITIFHVGDQIESPTKTLDSWGDA